MLNNSESMPDPVPGSVPCSVPVASRKVREAHNASVFVWAHGFQSIGDQLISPKVALPWLFSMAGVPHAFSSLLVPIRESGSMLPQRAIVPWILSLPSRRRIWIIGSLGQGSAAAAIALSAAFCHGNILGLLTLFFLAILSIFRAICSIASKDVQGRTISKGSRGRVTGRTTVIAGVATVSIGVLWLLTNTGLTRTHIITTLAGAASMWFFAAVAFRRIDEPQYTPPPEHTAETSGRGEQPTTIHPRTGLIEWSFLQQSWELFRTDSPFRSFVTVRTLLLTSALSTSFIVVLAQSALPSGLGFFLIAAGSAELLGGTISGRLSDISSRTVMSVGALVASIIAFGVAACATWGSDQALMFVGPMAFFLTSVAHSCIRVARQTYVVDMAQGDRRTLVVSSANTIMGVMLLLVGAASAVLAFVDPAAALAFLAVLGGAGCVRARRMPDVSVGRRRTGGYS